MYNNQDENVDNVLYKTPTRCRKNWRSKRQDLHQQTVSLTAVNNLSHVHIRPKTFVQWTISHRK